MSVVIEISSAFCLFDVNNVIAEKLKTLRMHPAKNPVDVELCKKTKKKS